MIWVALYVAAVGAFLWLSHRHAGLAHAREQAARDSEAERLGGGAKATGLHDDLGDAA